MLPSLKPIIPLVAASLLQGIEEMLTVNELGPPPMLARCLATTNIVENPTALGARSPAGEHWQDREMIERWVALVPNSVSTRFKAAVVSGSSRRETENGTPLQ